VNSACFQLRGGWGGRMIEGDVPAHAPAFKRRSPVAA
jgi:hypothetical protein